IIPKAENRKMSEMDTTKRKGLRSSLDVYNRLIWDKTLSIPEPEKIKVGYNDNRLGTQEVGLEQWKPVSQGGDVPFHHVIYFKWKNIYLWHREKRLDRLFGSGDTTEPELWQNVIRKREKASNRVQQDNGNKGQAMKNLEDNEMSMNVNDNNNNNNNNVATNQKTRSSLAPNQQQEKEEEEEGKKSGMATKERPEQAITGGWSDTKQFPRYPEDTEKNDGFMQSFEVEDTKTWLPILKKYGLVVLRVLSPQECQQSINALLDEAYTRKVEILKQQCAKDPSIVNQLKEVRRVDLENPATWKKENFPNPNWVFLFDRPAFHPIAFRNRFHVKVYAVFKTLYGGDANLNVSIDNWGIYRGTKDLTFKESLSKSNANTNANTNISGEKDRILQSGVQRPDWRKSLNPHWDINPWTYSEMLECGHYVPIYQGAIALSCHRLQDGVHLTLPGCTPFLKRWCEMHPCPNSKAFRHNLDLDNPIADFLQPIPLRAGEMVVWDYGQLHGTSANQSNRMRLVQYIRMFPSQQKYSKRDHYSCQNILLKYKRDVNIDHILQQVPLADNCVDQDTRLKLLGLKKW
ncbi:hypothetical protein RFI_04399, partial [Reticulomyxa filosa]